MQPEDLTTETDGTGWLSIERQIISINGAPRLSYRLKGEPQNSASRRLVPIHASEVETINEHIAVFGLAAGGFVFGSPKGEMISPNNFGKRSVGRPGPLVRAAKLAGLEDDETPRQLRVIPYTIRHSHASWLDAAGVPLAVQQQRLGHIPGSRVTQRHYVKVLPGAQTVALDLLRPLMSPRRVPARGPGGLTRPLSPEIINC